MDSITQHGYLVLADISGYTSFVARTELEHAHEILTDLLEVVLKRLTGILALSKLEGDAVFAFAPEQKVPRGETVLELVEGTYVAFRDRAQAVQRNTTCTCKACQAIPSLDLKLLAHYGDYIVQNVAGVHELVGSDVNLIHRLLKNHIAEATGWRAYALFTEPCLAHMGVRPANMHPQVEGYEHLGDVQTHSLDLRARYAELTEARRIVVKPEEADWVASYEFPAPPAVVWDWMIDPARRTQWMGSDYTWSAVARPGGRTGPGASNHCAHGKQVHVETIVDWRPFEYCTTDSGMLNDPNQGHVSTMRFEPTPGGTRMTFYSHSKFRLPDWIRRPFWSFMMGRLYSMPAGWANAARLMAAEAAERQAETAAAPAAQDPAGMTAATES